TIFPSNGGAHNWSPMSYSPLTGLVYVPTTPNSSRTFLVEPDFKFQEGRMNTGVPRGGRGASATPTVPPSIGPTAAEGQRGGVLLGWDPISQKERWRAPGGGGAGGGTMVTAGNLLFQVINDGRLLAYSADKGEKLLDLQTGQRGGMGPPITYMLDGKQYIALMGGTGAVGNRGAPPAPGPAPAPAGADAAAGPPAGRGAGAGNGSPDVANAQAAQRGGAAAGPGPGGPGPGGFPPGPPPVSPKLLVFMIDGKASLPTQQ